MRALFLYILFLCSAISAHAAVSLEELQAFAYEGDEVAVENAIEHAHQQSLVGEITYEELRGLIRVLTRSHPDMETFRRKWLEAMPQSAYALTVQSWALYNDSLGVRGSANTNSTPKRALIAHAQMKDKAHAMIFEAYQIAPDFVPASDGVISMQMNTRRMWQWHVNLIIKNVMVVTPNYGSLTRASYLSDRRWGGEGTPFNVKLCNSYADKLPEYPDLSKDACIVSLMATNRQIEENWPYVADILDREDHVVLEYARVLRAVDRVTEQDRQIVTEYLQGISFGSPWLHNEIRLIRSTRERIFSSTRESLSFYRSLGDRFYDEIRSQLVHDPFRIQLLKFLINSPLESNDNQHLSQAISRNYLMRIAIAQPYHVKNWTNVAIMFDEKTLPPFMTRFDTADQNAIAYSDHNLFIITNYFKSKISQYNTFMRRGDTQTINGMPWPAEADFMDEVGCRIVRLIRLFENAAAQAPEHRNHIDGFRINANLDEITNQLKEHATCDYIWDAPIDELLFEAIPIDRHTLITIE